jgi:pSer/pThr/pTyr-binding forkhead associated (FHA) protein
MPFLYCIRADGAALSRCPVQHRALIVGRSKSADVSIAEDDWLSHEHFLIVPDERGFLIRDLGSKNGTWVNGERIAEHRLRPHERILAGRSRFALEPGLQTMVAELTGLPWLAR